MFFRQQTWTLHNKCVKKIKKTFVLIVCFNILISYSSAPKHKQLEVLKLYQTKSKIALLLISEMLTVQNQYKYD